MLPKVHQLSCRKYWPVKEWGWGGKGVSSQIHTEWGYGETKGEDGSCYGAFFSCSGAFLIPLPASHHHSRDVRSSWSKLCFVLFHVCNSGLHFCMLFLQASFFSVQALVPRCYKYDESRKPSGKIQTIRFHGFTHVLDPAVAWRSLRKLYRFYIGF